MAALQLIIEHGTRRKCPAPVSEAWRDPEGMVRGYVYNHDSRDCVLLPGLAVFEFEREGGHVTAFPEASSRLERIEDAFYRCVLPMALQARGCEVLHSSAVRTSGGAVVGFCGLARSGKSTIAVGLSHRGYPLWANDALVFEVAGGSVQALPVPFSVRLRPDSEAFFGRHTEPDEWIEERCKESIPVAAICVLNRVRESRSPSGGVNVRRLSPAAALRALLTHACCFTTEDAERKRRTMRHYLNLVSRVPIFAISFATGLQHLPVVLDAVEGVLEGNGLGPALVGSNVGSGARPAEVVRMTME